MGGKIGGMDIKNTKILSNKFSSLSKY